MRCCPLSSSGVLSQPAVSADFLYNTNNKAPALPNSSHIAIIKSQSLLHEGSVFTQMKTHQQLDWICNGICCACNWLDIRKHVLTTLSCGEILRKTMYILPVYTLKHTVSFTSMRQQGGGGAERGLSSKYFAQASQSFYFSLESCMVMSGL